MHVCIYIYIYIGTCVTEGKFREVGVLARAMLFFGALYRVVLGGCCKGNIYKAEKLRT